MIILDKVFEDKTAAIGDLSNFAAAASTRYNGDAQCSKDIVIVISRQDRLSYADPGREVGISQRQLTGVVGTLFEIF